MPTIHPPTPIVARRPAVITRAAAARAWAAQPLRVRRGAHVSYQLGFIAMATVALVSLLVHR